jgi:hypothetical protein
MIDYGKAFSFFTEDDHWLEKLGIGVGVYLASFLAALLVALIPSFIFYLILPWTAASNLASWLAVSLSTILIAGYGLRLLRNVRDGNPRPLPEWNDWGNDLVRGFKLVVLGAIWALPGLIFSIPMGIGTAMTSASSDSASFFGSLLLLCGSCLALIYWLFVAVMTPGYTLAFLRDEQIQSGLRFDLIFAWTRRNLGPVVTVAIVSVLATIVIFFLGVIAGPILLCVGWIITLPLAVLLPMLIQYHLYGQLGREFPIEETPTPPTDPDLGAPTGDDFAPPAVPA